MFPSSSLCIPTTINLVVPPMGSMWSDDKIDSSYPRQLSSAVSESEFQQSILRLNTAFAAARRIKRGAISLFLFVVIFDFLGYFFFNLTNQAVFYVLIVVLIIINVACLVVLVVTRNRAVKVMQSAAAVETLVYQHHVIPTYWTCKHMRVDATGEEGTVDALWLEIACAVPLSLIVANPMDAQLPPYSPSPSVSSSAPQYSTNPFASV